MLSFWAPAVWGQQFRYPLRSAFLAASAGFARSGSTFSVADNPALAASFNKTSIGAYAENEYSIKSLNFLKLSAMLATGHSGGGITLSHLGNSHYREAVAGVYYAKSTGAINLGVAFRYNYFYSSGAYRESALDYTVSASWALAKQVVTVVSCSNPYVSRKAGRTIIAPAYSMALGYAASDEVFAEVRFIKEEDRALQASIALHIVVSGKWTFRTGCWPSGFRPFIALDWQQSFLRFLVAVSYHPTLGASPGLLVGYEVEHQNPVLP